ncbi:hypothetical protein HBA54_03910 [Pelagibius litoralis]|uniref:Hint domain-containing protein n=1 Tax=Pelagibius litoralis TaxID=374515 RepID=A0A967EUY6_9PROT|nr:Hint domain-containing protein [Pelagibius litoralis]NIA67727.1 hypothetical protein [Pelagibius litoralis]
MPSHSTSKNLRLLAGTSLLALSFAASPLTVSIDWQDGPLTLQSAEAKSCFTAETRVLMADGSEKPICEIVPGDSVLGGNGRMNRVVAVERPGLGERKLFAFNGGEAFVTAEHPFLTPAGWKAIDPIATADENPTLKVARLAVGDLLMAALPAGAESQGNLALVAEVVTRPLPLERIESVSADPAMLVYNLLLDGDHSYIANGLIVHNKGGEGGESGGGNSGGGEHGGGESGEHGGGESGEHGGGESGEHGGGESGEHGGGESGEHGGGESGEHGESGESAETDDDDDHRGRGRGRGRGDDQYFADGNAQGDGELSSDQEAAAINEGWQ